MVKEIGYDSKFLLEDQEGSTHIIGKIADKVVGYARIYIDGDHVHYRNVCFLKEHRGKGFGRALNDWLFAWLKTKEEWKGLTVRGGCREEVYAFLSKMGWTLEKDVFELAGMNHRHISYKL